MNNTTTDSTAAPASAAAPISAPAAAPAAAPAPISASGSRLDSPTAAAAPSPPSSVEAAPSSVEVGGAMSESVAAAAVRATAQLKQNGANGAAGAHVVVIGAGLAGLAAAHRLVELSQRDKRPLRLTLLDASGRAGGAIATRQLGDYGVVESGADMFITDKPWGRELAGRLGIADQMVSTNSRYRRSLILSNGVPVPVPAGFALMAPGKLLPMVKTPLLSPLGKIRLAADLLLPRRVADSDESIAAFVRRRMGQEALDRLIQPLVGGIYTGDPDRLSLRATLPRFIDMEQEQRSLIVATIKRARDAQQAQASGARYGLFASFQGGMKTMIDALVEAITPHATLRLACMVSSVDPAETGYSVTLRNGESLSADAVVMAAPAYRSADMLAAHMPALARRLRSIRYASTAMVLSGHRLEDIEHSLDAFGMVVPMIEKRRILAVSFASRKLAGRAPDGHVLLRTFVGGDTQPELYAQSDVQIEQLVKDELASIFGVGGRADFVDVVRYKQAMPQYEVGHLERVAAIEASLLDTPRLALAGNAYHGVGIPDVIHDGEQAAEQIYAASNLPAGRSAQTLAS